MRNLFATPGNLRSVKIIVRLGFSNMHQDAGEVKRRERTAVSALGYSETADGYRDKMETVDNHIYSDTTSRRLELGSKSLFYQRLNPHNRNEIWKFDEVFFAAKKQKESENNEEIR